MIAIIAAVLAGAVAAVVRWLLSRNIAAPWAVLVVNVLGSAIGGAVLGLAQRGELSSDIRLIVLGGLCGGLTTFSTWSVETIQLVLDRKWRIAALSVAANLVLGIGAAALAYAITV
jgi:CrcB protein